LKNKRIRKMER